MFFKKLHRCDFNKWGRVVDTGNHIYRAQFRSCKVCNKTEARFISLYTSSACEVAAKTINETIDEVENDKN